MIKEAIDSVAERAIQTAKMHQFQVGAEPKDVYFLQNIQNGGASRIVAEAPPRAYTAARLCDVVALVKEFNARTPEKKIVVFAAGGVVTVLLDENGQRRERICLHAPRSAQYETLEELDGRGDMGHLDFLDLLKIELHGAVLAEFIGLVRSMKFTANASGTSNISPGRESLGRAIENEVLAGGAEIPESVVVTVPVYEDLVNDKGEVFVAAVECVFRVSAQKQSLKLLPLEDQMLAAVRRADAWVLEQLKPLESLGENVRVFCGAA